MRAAPVLLAFPVLAAALVPLAAGDGAAPFTTLTCPLAPPNVDPARPLERCNLRASAHTGPANEIDLAMDPADPGHLVTVAKGYNYTRIVGGAGVGAVITPYATTFDGGLTWTEGYLQDIDTVLLDVPLYGPIGTTNERESDPIVEFTACGTVLANTLRVNNPGRGLPNYRSLDGGRTFQYLSHAYGGGTDKQWFVSDPATGNLYLATAFGGGVGFTKSADCGATWTAMKEVCDCRNAGIDVGPGGVVYVTGMAGGSVVITRSTDQGATWSPLKAIGPHTGSQTTPLNLRLFRTINIPQVAASRVDGGVYVVWANHNDNAVQALCEAEVGYCPVPDTDVVLAQSHDSGLTWQPLVRLNDDLLSEATMQFMPQVAVSPNGRDVHVAWLDQRVDPSGLLAEAYYAHSPDGGATWDPNLKLSDQPFLTTLSHHQTLVPLHTGVFVGDYIGLQASDDRAVVAFPDTRYGRSDVFVATVV